LALEVAGFNVIAIDDSKVSELRAEPVAPHPRMTARAAASRCWPSVPIPGKRIWREYRSSKRKGTSELRC
jgi:hypothetical protein